MSYFLEEETAAEKGKHIPICVSLSVFVYEVSVGDILCQIVLCLIIISAMPSNIKSLKNKIKE